MSDTFIAILIISAAIIVWAVRKYKKEIAKYLPQILPYVTPSWVPFYKKVDEPGEKDGDKKPGKKPDKKKESKKTSWWSALLILLGVNIALTLLFPAFYGWGWTNWQSVMGINVVIIIMALIAHWDGWFFKTVCVLGLLLVGFGWFLNYTPTGKDLATEWDNLQKLREAGESGKTPSSHNVSKETMDEVYDQEVIPKGGKATLKVPKGAFNLHTTDHYVAVVKDSVGFELRTVRSKEGDTFLGINNAAFMECTSADGEEITVTVLN